MAGRLAIDFGNAYTVLAYWRQASRQAEALYLPGVTRPMPGSRAGNNKGVFAAPSVIAYKTATGECLIGQEAVESGLAADVFHDLQFAVLTGKRVNNLVGSRWLCSHDMARDYLATLLLRAAQTLGLGSEAVLAFTMSLAACKSELIWRRYRCWLESVAREAGFSRLEFIEEPWAAAWGAGMAVKPEECYLVVRASAAYSETAMVLAANQAGDDNNKRHIRVISDGFGWLTTDGDENQWQQELTAMIRQVLREAARQGYTADRLAGIVVTGSSLDVAMPVACMRRLFPAIPVYDRRSWTAIACGAAVLTAGLDGCGYLRYRYTLRYLAGDGYYYRELVPRGLFYPSEGPVAELTIRASYDSQREFALWLYRGEEQCINGDNPLILTTGRPTVTGQAVMRVQVSLDGAGQLVVTATELASGNVITDHAIAAKLM